jgi:tetratricopeptide (TPR) repeat protein
MRRRVAALSLGAILCLASALPAQWAHLAVNLDTLVAAAARDSLDPVAQYEVGIGYWTAERYDQADSALRRAIRIEPRTAAAYLALSFLPYARPQAARDRSARRGVPSPRSPVLDEADRFYRRAFMIDPMVDLKVFGLLLPPMFFGSANRVTRGFLDGIQGFFAGQYELAFSGFDVVFNSVPEKDRETRLPSGLLWYHGLAAAHVDRYGIATRDFGILLRRATEAEKTDSLQHFASLRPNEIRYILAALEQEAGQRDSALAHFEEVATADLGQYMAHVHMADIYEFRQQWDPAIEERRRAVASDPDDSSVQYELGLTLARSHHYAEARDALAEAARLNPLNVRIPYVLGKVQVLLHETAEARATFTRFVAMAPGRFHDQVVEAQQQLATLP